MSARPFLDTNVLIYAFATGDARKTAAEQCLAQGGTISVQVLNEFAAVSSRKLGLSWSEIAKRIEVVKALVDAPTALTETNHDTARELAQKHKIAFYDALIVAAALAAKCDVLWSEDFQPSMKFGTLTARNPFAAP